MTSGFSKSVLKNPPGEMKWGFYEAIMVIFLSSVMHGYRMFYHGRQLFLVIGDTERKIKPAAWTTDVT